MAGMSPATLNWQMLAVLERIPIDYAPRVMSKSNMDTPFFMNGQANSGRKKSPHRGHFSRGRFFREQEA
jgi:hypothetical protein